MQTNWPVWSGNGESVNAIDIQAIKQLNTGAGEITPTNSYPKLYVTNEFMGQWNPAVGGYLISCTGSPVVYMSKTAFEAAYTKNGTGAAWAEISGKPSTFAPVVGTTATTAMAGNKVPTATERGGVLLQTAIVALTDSSGGTSGGNTVAAIPAVVAAATSADTATLPTKASVDATVTAIKNDVATLAAKYNALLAAVKAAGITA